MKLQKIIEMLENFAPKELAEEWDNVGLMLGHPNKEVKKVSICLDVADPVIDEAVENTIDLIISHHPFIMSGIKSLDFSTPQNSRIEKLIKNNIAVYSMHTNFDSCIGGINDIICEKLDLINYQTESPQILRKGALKTPLLFAQLLNKAKTVFGNDTVMACGVLDKEVKTVAVCGGGGGSFIQMAKNCDVYITGEIKYHEFQMAQDLGISVITCGHFETENLCLFKIKELLELCNLDINLTKSHNGFSVFY